MTSHPRCDPCHTLMTARKHDERCLRPVSSPYRYVFPFLTVFYILSLTIINSQVYYVLDTTHHITTSLKTPQTMVVWRVSSPQVSFFFSFLFLNTNKNFLLHRLHKPIQPPPTPPRRFNCIDTSIWHPLHKKRPKRRFIPPFGPPYAPLWVPRHHDGHLDDEQGLETYLEPVQVSFLPFLLVFSYFTNC